MMYNEVMGFPERGFEFFTHKNTSRIEMKRLRLIIITLFLINILAFGFLAYCQFRAPKIVNQYPLLDIARSFIPQEHFVVNLQPLREELTALVEREGKDSISLYFEFLNTGANISVNPNLSVWPASLPKVPMAMAVMKKIERGEWALHDELVLFEQDKSSSYGSLWRRPVGTRFTIEDLLREILIESDNTAYRILLRNMDFADLENVVTELGLDDLFTDDGLVSAKEYSRLFRALYVSSFLKREDSEQILTWLGESEYRDFVAGGIPSGVLFSHKFGIDRDKHAYLDSGIVYVPSRPYLITVAVQGVDAAGDEERVKKLMKEIGEKTFTYVSRQ